MISKSSRTGRRVAAVTVKAKRPSAASVPTSSAAERPFGVSEIWRKAVRRCKAATGRSMARSNSPACSAFSPGPRMKSITGSDRAPPSGIQILQTPSSAVVSAAIGPAGSARQRLPPTVAPFQILNDPNSARQHWRNNGLARQEVGNSADANVASVQVAPIRRPSAPVSSAGQPSSTRSISRVSAACGSENSQVPPASQASPERQGGRSFRHPGRLISVTVFKSIKRPRYATVVTARNINAITPRSSVVYLGQSPIAPAILVETVKYRSRFG